MSRSGPVGVGLIGAGMISDTYLENLTSFRDVRVLIVGDLDRDRARTQSAKYQVPESGGADDVLSHADVELVVNLTIPAVHAQVSSEAVAAGKHVWSEKPISIDRESGRALLESADNAGLPVGVAPDTVLGQGIQTARERTGPRSIRGASGRPPAVNGRYRCPTFAPRERRLRSFLQVRRSKPWWAILGLNLLSRLWRTHR